MGTWQKFMPCIGGQTQGVCVVEAGCRAFVFAPGLNYSRYNGSSEKG